MVMHLILSDVIVDQVSFVWLFANARSHARNLSKSG